MDGTIHKVEFLDVNQVIYGNCTPKSSEHECLQKSGGIQVKYWCVVQKNIDIFNKGNVSRDSRSSPGCAIFSQEADRITLSPPAKLSLSLSLSRSDKRSRPFETRNSLQLRHLNLNLVWMLLKKEYSPEKADHL